MKRFWLIMLALVLVGCGSVTQPARQIVTQAPLPPKVQLDQTENFSGANAMKLAETQMQWIPRDTGTPGWQANGDWILQTLIDSGWDVEEQFFSVPENKRGRNIIAKRGTGPLTIIGAHYDARRFADAELDPALKAKPVPAANDGASGVAVLLELARVLKPERLNEEVWLTFFDAEDNGDIGQWDWILGSTDVAAKLESTPKAVIVVDMIGDADQQIYYEQTSNRELMQQIWQVAANLKYPTFIPEYKHSMIDDHTPFLRKGYPAITIIDFDYPYWHTVSDTIDKLSPQSLESVGRTLEVWLTRD